MVNGRTRSAMPSPRIVARVVSVIVLLSIVTNLARSQALIDGIWALPDDQLGSASRFAREALIWGLAGWLMVRVARHKKQVDGAVTISPIIVYAGLAILLSVGSSLLAGASPLVVVAGLRALPLLLILAALAHYTREEVSDLAGRVTKAALLFVLVQAGVAAYQVLTGIPALYGATFLGPRPYGTMSSPNTLGVSVVAVLILVLLTRPRWTKLLSVVCVVVITASGTRTALLSVLLIGAGLVAAKTRYRWLFAPTAGFAAWFAYSGVTDQFLSGRVIREEGRLAVWADSLSVMKGLNWVIGESVGYATNASLALTGMDTSVAAITDSAVIAILLSFGTVGLVAGAVGVGMLVRRTDPRVAWLYVPTLLMVSATMNSPEIAPYNVLTVVAAGMGLLRREQDESSVSAAGHLPNRASKVRTVPATSL